MRRLVPALLGIALVLAVTPAAHAKSNGRFLALCGYSHSRQDDPIVRPGQPGASHLHDFLGNTTTTAFSTYESMTGASIPARRAVPRRGAAAPSAAGPKAAPAAGTIGGSPAFRAYQVFLQALAGAFDVVGSAGLPLPSGTPRSGPLGTPRSVPLGTPSRASDRRASDRRASDSVGGPPGIRTRCTARSGDTASYWTPALYRNGVKVDPRGTGTRQQVYYDRSNLLPGTRVETIPADLRVKAGVSRARSLAENPGVGREIYWGCSDNSTSGKSTVPPAHCPTGIITLHLGFPNCWDGVLTHVDDSAHLAYPKRGRCVAPFAHVLPRVILRWEYPVGPTTGLITLSSGSLATVHGDFWNTWQQPALTRLVHGCINAGRDCGKR